MRAGVAVPPREDGRAHHRQQTGHRWVERGRVPQDHAVHPGVPRPLGHAAPAVSGHIIDISPVLRPSIAVWPGDTPMSREVLADLAHGANLTLSTLHGTVHLGAHTDSPGHTDAGGGDIASQPLDAYLGRCQVVQVEVARGA